MDTWSPEQLWRLTIAEVSRRRVAVITCFVVVSLASLLLGAVMPKSYSSAATVLAERREILSPLLEGSAVGSAERVNDQDRLRFYRELLFSRNIMLRVIKETGLINVDNKNVALE
ncbi:MAG: Wzz/FepE/Etk N-terminal domain-containing protein, partial [Gammaproteobacteria bacterium]|nr:Wzz/FepE/Etk N-terminal domain-containing protein [Gammaproteobacteria bacterium]